MASVANNIQKIVRHHIPLIRFKYGMNQSGATSHGLQESKTNVTVTRSAGAPSQSKTTGHKSDPLEFSQTPKKYRRRPLTQDEIDLVAVGGFT
ncbi:unnamed protein product [Rotaria magnacalcarata]|uniref:Mitochondrial ribosomal protein S36 n=1 Tax=Rotaria magnacalcarata TaxID=392030 RepID=A0A815JH56_9BILA|nr:unnamed protein product [Rotaria magnacalcarata]